MMNRDNEILIDSPTARTGYDTLPHTSPVLNTVPKKLPQYVATISATLSAFAAGTVLGWTSPIVDELKNGGLNNITINDSEIGWIGSLSTLGAMLTCIPTGFICDAIGSRYTLIMSYIPYAFGWFFVVRANEVTVIYIGRFLCGIGAGITCVAAPMYTSEVAHKDIRGSLGSYFQLMVTVGILFAYFFGAVVGVELYTYLCTAILFFFALALILQPNSPVYYRKKNLLDATKIALQRLRGANYDVTQELVELESSIKSSEPNIGFIRTFTKRGTLRGLFIALSLMIFQQLSGINAVIFYTSKIFEDAGSSLNPKTATIIVGIFQVAATFTSSLIVDKSGRRILLMISSFFMGISMILLAVFLNLKIHHTVSDDTLVKIGLLPIIALVLYIVMFSIGLGPIPWMINGEVFAPKVKGTASSIASTFNWFLAFFITKFILEINNAIGEDVTFFTFAAILFIATLFVYLFIPEMKGKAATEIEDEMENSSVFIHRRLNVL